MSPALLVTLHDLVIGFIVTISVVGLTGLVACIFFKGAHSNEPASPRREPKDPAALDDWLAAEEPLLDFKVYERSSASTSTGGAR